MKASILVMGILLMFFSSSCQHDVSNNIMTQEEVLKVYHKNGAKKYSYLSKEWQEWIDKGLAKDSTIAYLWSQKALPYWKVRQYDIAMEYYANAVKYDRKRYLGRSGFLKCIFAKAYPEALKDLNDYTEEFGAGPYENDHSLEFYKAICYLQLGQFDQALNTLKKEVEKDEKERGKDWVHFIERFYLGIIYYELNDYENAIIQLDKSLAYYPEFSDAKYWKSKCLNYLEGKGAGKSLLKEAKADFMNGNTFNEDSSHYEYYPYQITWQWKHIK